MQTEAPDVLTGLMIDLQRRHNIQMLGGCCGTDPSHIECIGTELKRAA